MARYEEAVERASIKISAALDEMVAALPDEVAPHMAVARLIGKLSISQTQRMQWIMEDPIVRETYEIWLSRIPATRGRTDL